MGAGSKTGLSGRAPARLLVDWWLFQRLGWAALTLGLVVMWLFWMRHTFPRLGPNFLASPVLADWPAFNGWLLSIHIVTAVPPLVIGFFAMSPGARRYSPRLHRWIGTIYCLTIFVSSLLGLILATANEHGIWARLGFGLLAVVWFATTFEAYRTARAKQFRAHRAWMLRSFAVTVAVITYRAWGQLFTALGIDPETSYVLLTWFCWVPNLMFVEWYVRATNAAGKLVTSNSRSAGASEMGSKLTLAEDVIGKATSSAP